MMRKIFNITKASLVFIFKSAIFIVFKIVFALVEVGDDMRKLIIGIREGDYD